MPVGTSRNPGTRLSAATLTLAGIGATSLVARIFLELLRRSDECGSVITLAFEWLVWIALLSSALAVVLGVVGLAVRSRPIARTVIGTGLAVIVGILLFAPGFGFAFIVCSESAA